MKVTLLYPNYDAHVIHPPLGLGYLASYLRVHGHSVSLYDGTLRNATYSDFVAEIDKEKPNLVGISVLTRGHVLAKQMIRHIKSAYPHLPIVIGGTQVSAAPIDVCDDLRADFGVIGEGEQTLLELADVLASSGHAFQTIDGLVFRPTGSTTFQINHPRVLIGDLDSLPFPAWDLMPPDAYRIVPILEPAKGFPIAPILTTRGCPYQCSFCASGVTWKHQIRYRSAENIIREIMLLKKTYKVKELHISDDNFTMDPNRAMKICEVFMKKRINLPWQCPNGVRIDRLTPPLLHAMKQSGCYAVGLGIESGNQKILDTVNKHLRLSVVPGVLKNLRREKIESYGFFILGLPGDTRKTILDTINFALHYPFDRAWFNIFTPYPGSAAFARWLGKRKFRNIDWNTHDCSTVIISCKDVTKSRLERLQKTALRKFYLRPSVLMKLLPRIGYKELITLFMSRFFRGIARPVFTTTHFLFRRSR